MLLFHLFRGGRTAATLLDSGHLESGLHWLLTSGWRRRLECSTRSDGCLLAGPIRYARKLSRQSACHIRRYLLPSAVAPILPTLWVRMLVLCRSWLDGQMGGCFDSSQGDAAIRLCSFRILDTAVVGSCCQPASVGGRRSQVRLPPAAVAFAGLSAPIWRAAPYMATMWILLIAVARPEIAQAANTGSRSLIRSVSHAQSGLPLLVNCRVFLSCFAVGIATRLHQTAAARGDSRGIAANGLSFGHRHCGGSHRGCHLAAATYWRGSLMYHLPQPAVATGC